MKKFKLVLADHDGTIVSDDRVLSDRTREALEELHREGYLFGMASGRTVEDVNHYPQKWGLSFDFDCVIGLGGCQFYDGVNKKLYEENYLSKEDVKDIIEMMAPLHLPISMAVGNTYYFSELTDEEKQSAKRNKEQVRIQALSLEEFYRHDAPKIMFRMPEERMPEVEAYIAAHPSERYWGFKTQPVLVEFQNIKARKSNGLKKIEKLYGIKPEEVIYFGDTTNDNDLLAACYGVCMANGSEDTKAVSKEITEFTNNEDGMAIYLEENLLERKG